MADPLYKVPEVMEYLGMSRPTVYRYIRSGQLKSVKIGGLRRVTESALREFVNDHTEGGAA